MSRSDVPSQGSRTEVGFAAQVQGVAFAGDRGIERVEVSTDDGVRWAEAALEDEFGPFAWCFWSFDSRAAAREQQIRVRATDGMGTVQTEMVNPPLPNGATGYHRQVLREPCEA
jgi:hypothetical protein